MARDQWARHDNFERFLACIIALLGLAMLATLIHLFASLRLEHKIFARYGEEVARAAQAKPELICKAEGNSVTEMSHQRSLKSGKGPNMVIWISARYKCSNHDNFEVVTFSMPSNEPVPWWYILN